MQPELSPFITKTKKPKNILAKISATSYFSTPGFIVQTTVNQKNITKKLAAINNPFSTKTFQKIKQVVVSTFTITTSLILLFAGIHTTLLLSTTAIFTIIFFLPDLYIQAKKETREKIFSKEVPYFLDLLILTLETGLNLEQALAYVSLHQKGQLNQEIKNKLKNTNLGQSLEEILETLKDSIPNEDFKNFISIIKQAKKLGISLAESLEIQSDLIRTQKKQKAEELSRTAAIKISIPLVLFIFPALLLIYIGPGILQLTQSQ